MAAELEILAPAPALPPPVSKPKFGASLALASFAMLFGAQFVAGLVVMVLAMAVALARGADPSSAAVTRAVTSQVMVPMLIAAATVSAVVAFVAARLWAWDVVTDRSPSGIGLVPARRQQVLLALLAGAIGAAAYLAVTLWAVPFDPKTPLGPLAQAAGSGGVTRLAWAALALVFAPLVEEFFFRGLLLRGFTASWGPVAGAIATTVLFVAMHLFEAASYWPAIVFITLLAIGTYLARRWSGSLVPAMAMHLGYNGALVVAVYARL